MEPSETQQNTVRSRAKEIDTGAVPLPLSNVLLGLPRKNDPIALLTTGSVTQDWKYAELVSQKQLLSDLKVDINTKDKLWVFENNWLNVLQTHFGNIDVRKMFGLKRWTLNFDFEFRSNFQQVGQFCLFYSNLPKTCENYFFRNISSMANFDPFKDYTIQTQLPHRKIPMGEDVDISVALEWDCPHSASFGVDMYGTKGDVDDGTIDTPFYDFGKLCLYVPWPMEVSTGVSSTMSVRIWTYLSNFKYGAYNISDQAI